MVGAGDVDTADVVVDVAPVDVAPVDVSPDPPPEPQADSETIADRPNRTRRLRNRMAASSTRARSANG
jgi:hypothetical protein